MLNATDIALVLLDSSAKVLCKRLNIENNEIDNPANNIQDI